MTNRLFISLDIPVEVQDNLIAKRDEIYGADSQVRWESSDKLHLTLKFLGDVYVYDNDSIIKALNLIVKKYRSIELSFTEYGLFYRDNNPKILWIGLKGQESLFELVNDIESEFEELGFKKEKRKFKPHITLLRLKGFEDFSKIKKFSGYELEKNTFSTDQLSLMESKLTPHGSIYTRLKSFKMN